MCRDSEESIKKHLNFIHKITENYNNYFKIKNKIVKTLPKSVQQNPKKKPMMSGFQNELDKIFDSDTSESSSHYCETSGGAKGKTRELQGNENSVCGKKDGIMPLKKNHNNRGGKGDVQSIVNNAVKVDFNDNKKTAPFEAYQTVRPAVAFRTPLKDLSYSISPSVLIQSQSSKEDMSGGECEVSQSPPPKRLQVNASGVKSKKVGIHVSSSLPQSQLKRRKKIPPPKPKTSSYFAGFTASQTFKVPLDFGWNKSKKKANLDELDCSKTTMDKSQSINYCDNLEDEDSYVPERKGNTEEKGSSYKLLRHSKNKRVAKSKLKCEDEDCVPCSVKENCNECHFCINRSSLK